MNTERWIVSLLPAALLLAGTGLAQAQVPAMTSGDMLTDAAGMTLYVFDKDSPGKSACNGGCATNWPPLMAATGAMAAGDYSVLTRDDGSKQWAFKGKPLYRWIKDTKAGDKSGDGVNGSWHIARP